jgi:alpha-tubulin suppressor-like RCC1 family protein
MSCASHIVFAAIPAGSTQDLAQALAQSLPFCPTNWILGAGRNRSGEIGAHLDGEYVGAFQAVCSPLYTSVKISCGHGHTMMLNDKGYLYVLGANHSGQLGLGNLEVKSINVPVQIPGDFVDISAGSQHSLVVTRSGDVFAAGLNREYQISPDSSVPKYPTLTKVTCSTAVKIARAYAAPVNNMLLDESGRVWAWGMNRDCSLGFGDDKPRSHPERVELPFSVRDIALSDDRTIFIAIDGKAYFCGNDDWTRVFGLRSGSIKTPRLIPLDQPVRSALCGQVGAVIVLQNGVALCYGSVQHFDNNPERPGPIRAPISNVKAVCGSMYWTVFQSEDGQLFGTGDNTYGQFGLGRTRLNTPSETIDRIAWSKLTSNDMIVTLIPS